MLTLEIRGWDRFKNRRQIASYTGLCPGIHNSNGRGSRRPVSIGVAIRWYVTPLSKWPGDCCAGNLIIRRSRNSAQPCQQGAKRRLVVAAARRLAIDLWRWATGRARLKN